MANEIEFRVLTDLAPIYTVGIETNYEEVRERLREMLEPYRSLAVTEEGLAVAREHRAAINRIRKNLEAVKAAVRSQALHSCAGIESQCKDLMALCDEAAGSIDRQVKAIEENRKQEKLERIRAFFDGMLLKYPQVQDYVNFESVRNPKWTNATVTETSAKQEIIEKLEKMQDELRVIAFQHSPFEVELLEMYARTHDIMAVLQHDANLRERVARQEAASAPTPRPPSPGSGKGRSDFEELPDDNQIHQKEVFATVRFEVEFRSREQMAGLRDYLIANGIAYRKIE